MSNRKQRFSGIDETNPYIWAKMSSLSSANLAATVANNVFPEP